MHGRVSAVCLSSEHSFSKSIVPAITLLAGLGVQGDAHLGKTVQHRSRVARDPTQPNLRQIHLIHEELLQDLTARGFTVQPGDLGENITTHGLDLLGLPAGTRLRIGAQSVVVVTGLRNPCRQIDAFQPGLLRNVLERTTDGRLIRKAGVMGIIETGGVVSAGDTIQVEKPPPPHVPLDCV